MQDKLDAYNSIRSTLYRNGDYAVQQCVLRDPMLQTDIFAYGVYNVTTGVREGEARRLLSALQMCDTMAEDMFNHMAPQGELFPKDKGAGKWSRKVQ